MMWSMQGSIVGDILSSFFQGNFLPNAVLKQLSATEDCKFLASQDAQEVMYVSESVSQWLRVQIETLLMWP